jgi:hypothetical protein
VDAITASCPSATPLERLSVRRTIRCAIRLRATSVTRGRNRTKGTKRGPHSGDRPRAAQRDANSSARPEPSGSSSYRVCRLSRNPEDRLASVSYKAAARRLRANATCIDASQLRLTIFLRERSNRRRRAWDTGPGAPQPVFR